MNTELTTNEQLVLQALATHASGSGAASGHHIRQELLKAGLGKKEIGEMMGSLVERAVLERLKVVDADGLFYMAYRRVQQKNNNRFFPLAIKLAGVKKPTPPLKPSGVWQSGKGPWKE